MNSEQLIKSLKDAFRTEKKRFAYRRAIVFWYDRDRTFENSINEIAKELDDVKLIILDDETSTLEIKILLELEDRASDYLLYSPFAEPSDKDIETDWLISIRLYSRIFRADRNSLIMNELGLKSSRWQGFISSHLKFFNQKNIGKLKKLGISDELKETEMLDKLLAVTVGSNEEEISSILMNLFSERDNADREKLLSDFESYGLKDYFWNQIEQKFGYKKSEPDPDNLLRHLFITDFAGTLRSETPEAVKHFLLPRQTSNLLAIWRDRQRFAPDYRFYADNFEKEFGFTNLLNGITADELSETHTFAETERHILREVRDNLLKDQTETNFDKNLEILAARRNSFWTQSDTAEKFKERIDALTAALRFFELKKKYQKGFHYPDKESFFAAYAKEIFLFDQYYRHFYESAGKIESGDFLKSLRETIEDCYLNWYIPQISDAWGKFVAGEDGFINHWQIRNFPSQQDFYQTFVAPILEKYSTTTVYVIISDAFRFEAAAELNEELNRRFGERKIIKAEITPQLGVLPSYTALGMASLLPSESLIYSPNGKDILADGMTTQGIAARQKILSKHEGAAIHLKQMLEMKTDEGRDFVRPHRVVYIYHDQIDTTGETATSEHKTFSAVRGAIRDIRKTINFIIKSLDGTHIFVTADHGFLFQQSKLEHHEKSSLEVKPAGMLKSNKRYIVGKSLGTNDKVWHGLTRDTAQTVDETEFWIPRGINRFRFTGGARFVHGGAMLQEICVPVVYARVLHGKKKADRAKNRLVNVTLINQNIRIVTNIHRFEFLQTDAVSTEENRLPRTLKISLRDGEELISNEVKAVFDSTSDKLDDRRKDVQLFLKQGEYDRQREYRLVLRDEATGVQYASYPVVIDLAFSSDF